MLAPTAALSQVSDSPMTFRDMVSGGNCDTCRWIAADGVIERSTADKFRAFLNSKGLASRPGIQVHLNSPGGNLLGGVLLGKIIREMKFDTVVSTSETEEVWEGDVHKSKNGDLVGECSSACAFAFVGGVNRYAGSRTPGDRVGFQLTGKLGVHQFYDISALSDPTAETRSAEDAIGDQFIVALLLKHLDDMGVSAELLQLASQTPPLGMHYLSDEELVRTRADNQTTTNVTLRGYRNGVATVELKFTRPGSVYNLELYCDNNALYLLSSITWEGQYDIESHKSWQFFDNVSLIDPMPTQTILLRKVDESFSHTTDGKTLGKFRFVFEGAPLSQLVQLKEFAFSDFSSRHANDAASQLGFRLPEDFDGVYLLPRTCR
jgi:hypothetical protein